MSKLTEEQIKAIPEKLKTLTIKQVADEYGVHERTINKWIPKLRASGYDVPTRVGRRPISLQNTTMECETCHKKTEDVSHRPNAYANDVGNDPTAMHTVCDSCDYENRMDI